MADTTSVEKHINIKAIFGYLGWAIIYTAIILGVGFYLGSDNQAKAQAHTDQVVQQAIKAVVTPASTPKE